MTDIEEVRSWARAAGLEPLQLFDGVWRCPRTERAWDEDDEEFIPLIAERLLARVRGMEDFGRAYQQALYDTVDPESYLSCATAEQRAAAAYKVLKENEG